MFILVNPVVRVLECTNKIEHLFAFNIVIVRIIRIKIYFFLKTTDANHYWEVRNNSIAITS